MYLDLFNAKFKDVLEVLFVKVPGHSNVVYNEKADQLAKSALIDKRKLLLKVTIGFLSRTLSRMILMRL